MNDNENILFEYNYSLKELRNSNSKLKMFFSFFVVIFIINIILGASLFYLSPKSIFTFSGSGYILMMILYLSVFYFSDKKKTKIVFTKKYFKIRFLKFERIKTLGVKIKGLKVTKENVLSYEIVENSIKIRINKNGKITQNLYIPILNNKGKLVSIFENYINFNENKKN